MTALLASSIKTSHRADFARVTRGLFSHHVDNHLYPTLEFKTLECMPLWLLKFCLDLFQYIRVYPGKKPAQ